MIRAMFGGSFDPVHHGHLLVAELLRQLEGLDRIFFVPARRSPHKRRSNATAAERLAMLRLALRGNPSLQVSDLELRRRGPSYSIDSVRDLRRRWRQKPVLLLGGDALLDLPSWREWKRILEESTPIVFARPGAERARRRARALGLRYHEVALSSVSSTQLRQLLRRGMSIRYQVPESVRRYIEAHRLYGWVPREEER
jgi:nicotinate-nucleotide adenylyltransferase